MTPDIWLNLILLTVWLSRLFHFPTKLILHSFRPQYNLAVSLKFAKKMFVLILYRHHMCHFQGLGKSNKSDWCKIHIVVYSSSLFWSEMDMERLLEEDAMKESVLEEDDEVKSASKNFDWIRFYLKVNVFKPQPEVTRLLRQQGIQLLTKRWSELFLPMDFEFWFPRFWQKMLLNEKSLYV